MSTDGRLLLACPHCGHPYRCQLYASLENFSVKQHYTCSQCHRGYALGDITAANVAAQGFAALMAALEDHVAKHPEDRVRAGELATLLARRGAAHIEQRDLEKAAADLGRACELDPDNAEYAELRDRVYDSGWGPSQISELVEKGDLNLAILMLTAYSGRHPEEKGALDLLASLYNKRAVQCANVAQKVRETQEDWRRNLDYEDGCFIRELQKTVILTNSDSRPDMEKNPTGLIVIALADISLAAHLAPGNSAIEENLRAIREIAQRIGIANDRAREIAESAKSADPHAKRKKRRGFFSRLFGG